MEAPHRQRSPWSKVGPDPTFPTVPRKPGLDGLRALAVIAVIVYHLNASWLPGGFFGVDVFFVVSGYLITSLLVSEFQRFGHIDLRRFWLARARRLLPSVVALFAVLVVVSCLVARDALPSLRTDVLFSLLYVVNWWLILHKVSYFATIGRPPLLLHMWSLAVEEQFYLFWPPILLLVLRKANLRAVLLVTVVGAAVSSALMAVLFHPGADPTRAYFGTDTHGEGLLIGCALAIVVPPWAPKSSVVRSARWLLGCTGLLAGGGLVLMLVVLGQYSPFDYPWGFVLVDLCSAVLIVMVVHPATQFGRLASLRPLRWVGTRSYALYLWHWPIIQLTRPDQDVSFSGWQLLALRVVLMATAAELSHRLVEIPFKRPELWAGWRSWVRLSVNGRIWAGLSTSVLAGVGAMLFLVPGNITPITSLAVGATAAAKAPIVPVRAHRSSTSSIPRSLSTSTLGSLLAAANTPESGTASTVPASTTLVSPGSNPAAGTSGSTPATTPAATTVPPTTPATAAPTTAPVSGSTTAVTPATSAPTTIGGGTVSTTTVPTTATTTAGSTVPPASISPPSTATPPTTVAPPTPAQVLATKEPVLAIGDSVLLAADPGLTAAFGPNITVDAAVGRQVYEGIARLQQYVASGQLATYKTVVIDLGTNGPLTPDLFDQLLQTLQGVPNVVFYNTYDPTAWEATTNNTLAEEVPQHPGVTLINWAAVAPGPGILYPDGIHPTPTVGGTAFAALLTAALS